MADPEPVTPGSAGSRTRVRLLGLLVLGGALLVVSPAWAATVVHHPYLQNMRADRVTIMWSTRENLTAVVQYSTDQTFSQRAIPSVRVFTQAFTRSSYLFYQYRADLTGLTPDTPYFYRVLMDGQEITVDGSRQFRTPGVGPFRFLAFGDSGAGTPEQLAIAQLMMAEQPNLVIHVGDIAYEDGTFDQFHDNHFEFYWPMLGRLPFFPVPGNHEYYTLGAVPYLSLHAPPVETVPDADKGRYYSFDWGDAHFVALDANLLDVGYSGTAELDWLEQDLAATTAKWRIVYWHQVPYPLFHHADDPICIAARQRFVPIVERHGVQLVLTGHEHEYFRSKPMHGDTPVSNWPGTVYITTGGGGGPLHPVVPQPWVQYEASVYHYLSVEVNAAQLTVHAIGINGKEFDRSTLTLPSLGPGAVVNAASFTSSLAPGGLVSIFGEGLATDTQAAAHYPLPTTIAGSTVSLNGTPLALMYASPRQINAQLPLDARGPAALHVDTISGVADATVNVSDTAPAVFPSGVLHLNGTPVSISAPAMGGEIVTVYLTGLGLVNGSIAAGQPAPFSPPLTVVSPVEVDIGNIAVTPMFAGLTPGFAGLYQVNVTVPADLPTNVYPLRVGAQGNFSNVTNVQVRARTSQ